ncbi:MAG TPA: DUF5680 domain-containing protein [Candidatus Saccharimonadales bacterium]|nr:DUF5680 domain-containing protein [Candidatus Saccharimonadales bacterium]
MKHQLERFILKARTKTYASAQGKSEPALAGSVQYEYAEGDFLYKDIYFIGNGIFSGLETVYYQDKPVWSMSYFGDFSQMTEEQTDKMLRKALKDNWESARLYKHVEKDYGDFKYKCAGQGNFDELSGTEEIHANNKKVYFLYYAGGFIG